VHQFVSVQSAFSSASCAPTAYTAPNPSTAALITTATTAPALCFHDPFTTPPTLKCVAPAHGMPEEETRADVRASAARGVLAASRIEFASTSFTISDGCTCVTLPWSSTTIVIGTPLTR